MSVRPEALALEMRFGRIVVPRLRRMEVGKSKRISLANAERRVDGDREVVTSGRGSMMPDKWAYSSSIANTSEGEGAFSSNLKSSRSAWSFAIDGTRGLPLASEAFNFARFSAVSASRSVSARRYK